MPYTPLKLAVTDPCHEDWNGMHPVPGTTARHCDSCVKNVVDFTGFTDAQLNNYVRDNGTHLCGRFRPDQLDRPLRAVSTPSRNPLKVAAAAAGVLLASAGLDAQQQSTVPRAPITGRIHVPSPPPPPDTLPQQTEDGFLLGEIESFELDTLSAPATDKISTPPKDSACTNTPELPMIHGTELGPMIMGLILVTPPEPTGIDWAVDTVKKALGVPPPAPVNAVPAHLEALTVSPNPFDRDLMVAVRLPAAETLILELLDPNGKLVHAETFAATKGNNSLVISTTTKKLTFGIYFLRVSDEQGRSVTRAVVRK